MSDVILGVLLFEVVCSLFNQQHVQHEMRRCARSGLSLVLLRDICGE